VVHGSRGSASDTPVAWYGAQAAGADRCRW